MGTAKNGVADCNDRLASLGAVLLFQNRCSLAMVETHGCRVMDRAFEQFQTSVQIRLKGTALKRARRLLVAMNRNGSTLKMAALVNELVSLKAKERLNRIASKACLE